MGKQQGVRRSDHTGLRVCWGVCGLERYTPWGVFKGNPLNRLAFQVHHSGMWSLDTTLEAVGFYYQLRCWNKGERPTLRRRREGTEEWQSSFWDMLDLLWNQLVETLRGGWTWVQSQGVRPGLQRPPQRESTPMMWLLLSKRLVYPVLRNLHLPRKPSCLLHLPESFITYPPVAILRPNSFTTGWYHSFSTWPGQLCGGDLFGHMPSLHS